MLMGLVVGMTPAFRWAETLLSMVLGDEDKELCQWVSSTVSSVEDGVGGKAIE